MSLYYEASAFLVSTEDQQGTLKTRIFGSKNLKSQPKQVFALVAEAIKWSPILSEIISKAQLLQHERKLSPSLSILLVHDLLLSKAGIAAPANHPLRSAVTRHKARLAAELTKLRIKKGCKSIDELRALLGKNNDLLGSGQAAQAPSGLPKDGGWPHPRWLRVNTLKTTLGDQLQTTFAEYRHASSIDQVLLANASEQVLYVDTHIPNLLALPPGANISTTEAYRGGHIIFQDKASCFPACLLDPKPQDGPCLDACAAPGNKTTHLAAILRGRPSDTQGTRLFACERDKPRAEILTRMVALAGCRGTVTIKAGQDFLPLDPDKSPWKDVGSLLLDPSCSGSGIVGRDEVLAITLPVDKAQANPSTRSRKRKRESKAVAEDFSHATLDEEKPMTSTRNSEVLADRLKGLSAFQLRLLLHAFRFPKAQKISYSTCSVYEEENENVIVKALQSKEANEYGWRLLSRDEQVEGMKSWHVRGNLHACRTISSESSPSDSNVAEACIRCEAGTMDGTQGFFVAAFVRNPPRSQVSNGNYSSILDGHRDSKEEPEDSGAWEGFSDID
ncbi:MAG: hypothetical protein Q9174_002626 [Haloplaca sp. 1 TL-2023]